uniref:Enkurin domain-containing protein n=2 Tax=Arion vulgaris TaxID=1028688 RepID=A0A0B7AG22_9EUPU
MMDSFNDHSIYNLLSVDESKEIKPKRYISRYQQIVKAEFASNQGRNKTLGPAKFLRPHPEFYMNKHVKDPRFPKRESFRYLDDDRKKPPVPKKTDIPLMGLKTTRNLICVNTVKNITSFPKIPTKRLVDTCHGDTFNLITSGHEPVYVHKKDFGEVPKYLTRRNEEMMRAQDEYDHYVAECFRKGDLRQLTVEEHKAIVDGLKTNWEDIQEQYNSLPVVTDTLGKKYRRERMEGVMKQLEIDIDMLEKHRVAYIGK